MRSIELNAVSVADNQLAFEWGRRAAWDSKDTARLAGEAEALPPGRRLSTDLAEVIARRRELLVAYQDEAYAQRYARLVDQVRTAEQAAVPGSTRLAETVARNAYRLMARKDEYEVARLFADDGFSQALDATFEGDFKVRVHIAPPLFSRPDPATGEERKRSYGPWMLRFLRLLSKGKVLRGTPLDVFGYTALRRMERALGADYERTIGNLVKNLSADNHQLACEIADVPDRIRGFGVVKQRNARIARERQLELMSAWSRQPGVRPASNILP
jgi:indolepyruvate ferredoxin oxidoreductase